MFTIIICTYNGAGRIGRVLDNVLKQDDFQDLVDSVLVIDNASNDNTSNIVNSLSQKNNRIRCLTEIKPGLSNARACGVRNCNSEWIIFLDDDNYIEQDWIKGANSYIANHPDVGAFNGNVIPIFNRELTSDEQVRLDIVYLGLACTSSSEKLLYHDPKKWLPFGAGLVIRTEPLKKLLNNGWLKSEGRKHNSIISGEDTEMVLHIVLSGYSTGFCNDIILRHDVGVKRLEMDYLKKLYYSFGVAHYRIISSKKLGGLRVVKYGTISKLKIMKMSMFDKIRNLSKQEFYTNILETCRIQGFFDAVHKRVL